MQQPSENSEHQSLDEQGLHAVSASAFSTSLPSIAPVNLDQSFAAANVEVNDVQPEAPLKVVKVLWTSLICLISQPCGTNSAGSILLLMLGVRGTLQSTIGD